MKHAKSLLVLLGVLALTLWAAPASTAAPPANDNFANATVITITSTPFSDTSDLTEATIQPGEPTPNPSYQQRTVWYSFTPAADAVVRIDRPFAPPDPSVPPILCQLSITNFLNVYRADGAGFAGLTQIASGSTTLHVRAATTYYIQGGDIQYFMSGCPNTFSLNVSVVPPPPNDNFADAIPFASVPFSDSRDLSGATIEPGEPMVCGASFAGSAWYAFTPTTSGSYGSFGISGVNVYTGTSLADLANVACSDWPGLYFYAEANRTYYLQMFSGGVRVDVVPPPAAAFIYSPTNPSTVDDVSFQYWNGGYWDPTVTGQTWDFGDGTTGTGSTVSHRFTARGDYSVTMTVTARGGRTNSQTQVVHVVALPTVTISRPVDGAVYPLDKVVTAAFKCVGRESGLASCVGTQSPGANPLLSGVTNLDTATLGSHSITVTGTDTAGNARTVVIYYTVVYTWNGFFSPIGSEADSSLNLVHAGDLIKVGFGLNGDRGLGVLASVGSVPVACPAWTPNPLHAAGAGAGAGLAYGASSAHYTYGWQTNAGWAGTCHQFQLQLNDGTPARTAVFMFFA